MRLSVEWWRRWRWTKRGWAFYRWIRSFQQGHQLRDRSTRTCSREGEGCWRFMAGRVDFVGGSLVSWKIRLHPRRCSSKPDWVVSLNLIIIRIWEACPAMLHGQPHNFLWCIRSLPLNWKLKLMRSPWEFENCQHFWHRCQVHKNQHQVQGVT